MPIKLIATRREPFGSELRAKLLVDTSVSSQLIGISSFGNSHSLFWDNIEPREKVRGLKRLIFYDFTA